MLKDLNRITKKLLINEGFFGNFLLGINKYEDNDIPSACVALDGINVSLHINSKFWDQFTDDKYRIAVLKHELLHIGYFHLDMLSMFSDKRLFNVAADVEINQYIDDFPQKSNFYYGNEVLNSDTCTIDNIEREHKLTLNRKAGTKYYYDCLNKWQNQDQAFQDFINSLGNLHPLWDQFDKLSPTQKELVKSQIEHQLKEAYEASGSNRGTIPGGLQDYIKKLLNPPPPVIDWRRVFRRYTGGSIETYIKKTKRKENTKFPDNPGLKVKTKLKGLLCVDVSGSVGNEELRKFFAQADYIAKTIPIDYLVFDTKVQLVDTYKARNTEVKIHGRGGKFVPQYVGMHI